MANDARPAIRSAQVLAHYLLAFHAAIFALQVSPHHARAVACVWRWYCPEHAQCAMLSGPVVRWRVPVKHHHDAI
jgi:hypothetical protein